MELKKAAPKLHISPFQQMCLRISFKQSSKEMLGNATLLFSVFPNKNQLNPSSKRHSPEDDFVGSKLVPGNFTLSIIVVYIPPSCSNFHYETLFEFLESSDPVTKGNFLLVGDFNIPKYDVDFNDAKLPYKLPENELWGVQECAITFIRCCS
ncbi:hypothetical protein JTB14_036522 [Gonioctena quinquepunctata]|nr:hypothetical protein JTB14_036522 [Gonioctena quinquepunctata]